MIIMVTMNIMNIMIIMNILISMLVLAARTDTKTRLKSCLGGEKRRLEL